MKVSIFLEHILQASEQGGKSVADVLRFARSLGISSLETNATFIFQNPGLQHQIKNAGFSYNCLYDFYDWDDFKNHCKSERHLQAAASLNAGKILFVPPYFSGTDISTQKKELRCTANMLRLVCGRASSYGITVLVEDFDNSLSPCSKIAYLSELFSSVLELRFNLDTGNFITNGEDVMQGYADFKNLIENVHLKDRSPVLASVPTGSGIIPVTEIVGKLFEDGYAKKPDANLTIEHFDLENQLEGMRHSCDFVSGLLE